MSDTPPERAPCERSDLLTPDGAPVRGVPGRELLRFAGVLSSADAREIEQTVEEGCEGVDPDP